MASCLSKLPNFGSGDCKVDFNEIKRIGFTSYKDNDNAVNQIAIADAATLSNIQALFDVPDWRDNSVDNDDLTKLVVTSLIYAAMAEQGDAVENTDDGYYKKLADGDYDFSFKLKEATPYFIKQVKKLEGLDLGVFLFDSASSGNARIWGVLNDDETNIDPLRISNISVPDFKPSSRETLSEVTVKFRVKTSSDMNKMYGVEISDSDLTSDVDFDSLINADMTVTSPATTGCTMVIATSFERGAEAVAGIPYTAFTFRNVATPTTTVTMTTSGSLTESPDGTYAVSETDIFVSGQSYRPEVDWPGYNIEDAIITIP